MARRFRGIDPVRSGGVLAAAVLALLAAAPAQAQYAAAKSEALLRSSSMYVRQCFGTVWTALRAGEPVTLEMRGRTRGSYVHAAENALEAVRLCYRAAGGSALWEKSPFEQALRDVNAVGCHITLQQVMLEEAGRVEFGLQPTVPFV